MIPALCLLGWSVLDSPWRRCRRARFVWGSVAADDLHLRWVAADPQWHQPSPQARSIRKMEAKVRAYWATLDRPTVEDDAILASMLR